MELGADSEMGRKWHDRMSEEKRQLPTFLFMAQEITPSANKKGQTGIWRKASNIRLNGLCFFDIDHLEDPKAVYQEMCKKAFGFCEVAMFDEQVNKEWVNKYGVLLVHITPSGHGLRFVFKADAERGNIADNQKWFADEFHLEFDSACKDSSRMSFAVPARNILFIDDQLFTYYNEKFEEKYGEDYRHGKSQPKKQPQESGLLAEGSNENTRRSATTGISDNSNVCGDVSDSSDTKNRPVAGVHHAPAVPEQLADGQAASSAPEQGTKQGILKNEKGDECYKYYGQLIPYREIVQKLVEARGGEPGVGGRNNMLYDLVRLDLRHICDNDESFVFRIAPAFGLSEQERKATIHQALSATRYGMSRTLRDVLQSFISERKIAEGKQDREVTKTPSFNHGEIWNTFKPFLNGPWEPVCSGLDDEIKFAGFLAAGAMFGTYLSACTLKNFYDNNDWRLSFMVYIIGQAASGKGAFVELNKLIMAPLRQRDEEGRKWEEKYKEDREKRSNSSSNQKAKAMEIEHFPIRVLPGTISNAMRYKRMKDSVRVINGEDVHLHCYIFESELSAKLRSEQGSWAGAQDLDCKSFSNEYGGNDYGNSQAVNGLIEVNMNQVITGTHDAMNRKITARNCLDGLATRLIVFEMPDSSFKMLKRDSGKRTPEQSEWLSTIGNELIDCAGIVDLSKKVKVPKTRQSDFGTSISISEALYQWGEDEAERCRVSEDVCADYFRRRAPVIAARYAAVDAIMNDLEGFKNTGKVKITWRQIELALHLASYFQESQMYFFGNKILDGLHDEAAQLAPQAKIHKKTISLYESLPNKFKLSDVQLYVPNYMTANTRIRRWLKDGIIEKISGKGKKAVYKKNQKVI